MMYASKVPQTQFLTNTFRYIDIFCYIYMVEQLISKIVFYNIYKQRAHYQMLHDKLE